VLDPSRYRTLQRRYTTSRSNEGTGLHTGLHTGLSSSRVCSEGCGSRFRCPSSGFTRHRPASERRHCPPSPQKGDGRVLRATCRSRGSPGGLPLTLLGLPFRHQSSRRSACRLRSCRTPAVSQHASHVVRGPFQDVSHVHQRLLQASFASSSCTSSSGSASPESSPRAVASKASCCASIRRSTTLRKRPSSSSSLTPPLPCGSPPRSP
jgi:hypothetical protein